MKLQILDCPVCLSKPCSSKTNQSCIYNPEILSVIKQLLSEATEPMLSKLGQHPLKIIVKKQEQKKVTQIRPHPTKKRYFPATTECQPKDPKVEDIVVQTEVIMSKDIQFGDYSVFDSRIPQAQISSPTISPKISPESFSPVLSGIDNSDEPIASQGSRIQCLTLDMTLQSHDPQVHTLDDIMDTRNPQPQQRDPYG